MAVFSEKKFSVAKAMVATLLSERARSEEHSFGFYYVGVALIGTIATIVFGRIQEKKSARELHVLIGQLSVRERVAPKVNRREGGDDYFDY